ncbi:MAG: VWA domain-containing protein [Bacteroidota bacterium]
MTHEKQMSSASPGLIIFLIDQSSSMMEAFGAAGAGDNKAEFAAKALNRAIYEIINANTAGEKVKDRCFITVIGYGASVKEESSGYLNELANNPLRIEALKKKMSDGAGGLIEIDYDLPVWVEAQANGMTPMGKGFQEAKYLVEEWIKQNPESPAPIIINISDGLPNDESAAEQAAKQIMSLASSDGNTLIFNVHIGTGSAGKIVFPSDTANLSANNNANFLYGISSEIPDSYANAASEVLQGSISPGAKGYVFNADAEDLINFLQFGSSKALVQDRVS